MTITNATLRVDRSKLNLLDQDFKLSINSIDNYNEAIYAAVSGLKAGWTGPDYDEFVNYFERYRATLTGISSMFDIYTKKISEYEEQGEILINAVEAALGVIKAGGKSAYNLADTGEVAGPTVAYAVNENPANAKEARLAAENARDNIYADMELLQQELKTIDVNKMALEKQKDVLSKMKSSDPNYANEYERLKAQLTTHEANVTKTLEDYSKVYDYVCKATERKAWPWSKDGEFVEANDAWFWTENDLETAISASRDLNIQLSTLPPVTTVIESAALNGLMAHGDEYLMKNFVNGSSVSSTMMETALIIANDSNDKSEKTMANGTNVVLFNSRAMIQEGYTDENGDYRYLYGESGSYTFAQDDAYGDYYGDGSTVIDGYDSVAIKDDNGNIIEYMTAEQYNRRYGGEE